MATEVIPMSVKATAYALDEQARAAINVTAVCRDEAVSRSVFCKYELAGIITLDQMEAAATEVATGMDLYVSHITVLGRVRYPGNRHWHLKRHGEKLGCLDLTYWPQGALFWVSIRNYEPAWVHEAGGRIGPTLEAALSRCGRRKGA